MTTTILLFLLFSALLHALWNAFAKVGSDPRLSIASFHIVAALIVVPIMLEVPLPSVECVPYLVASMIMHWVYVGFLGKAYRVGDLSQVYPVARGTAPLWVTLISIIFLGEIQPVLTVFGICLTCAGIIFLSLSSGSLFQQDYRPVALSFATGFSIAAYTLIDGLGVRNSTDPISYIAWLFFLTGISFLLLGGFFRRRHLREVFQYWREQRWVMLTGGLATAGAYGIVIYAMNQNSMAVVSALRETSVLIGVVIGVMAFKERFGTVRIGATVLVVGGVFFMNL